MLDTGWVKLHRSLLKWEWYDDINTKTVFLHLLLTVSIEDSKWHGITIPRGSRIASYTKLAEETKLSLREVRTAIQHLETTGEVTRSAYSKFTVFAIKNYDRFQETTSKRQADSVNNLLTSQKCDRVNDKQTNAKKPHKTEENTIPDFEQRQANRQAGDKVATSKRQQYKKVKESKEDSKKCVYAHDTSAEPHVPSPAAVKAAVLEIGAVWDDAEIKKFIEYNTEKGWRTSLPYAVKRWECNREKHQQPRKRSKEPEMTAREIEEMNEYMSLVNRFGKDKHE